MPGLDGVLDQWVTDATALLAPYQPNIPGYPNNDPRASTIVATKIGAGHPVQLDVTTRVENAQAQVSIYGMKPERVQVTEDNPSLTGVVVSGQQYIQVARTQKQFCIEVWADTRDDRQSLSDVLFSLYGVSYDLIQSDGTTTKIIYMSQVDDDADQTHTLYVRRFYFDVDFTLTQLFPTTTVATIVTTAAASLIASSSQTPPVETGTNL